MDSLDSASNSNQGSLAASTGSFGRWTHPDIETVKKKPPPVANKPVIKQAEEVRQSLVFTGPNTEGDSDADITIPDVQFQVSMRDRSIFMLRLNKVCLLSLFVENRIQIVIIMGR